MFKNPLEASENNCRASSFMTVYALNINQLVIYVTNYLDCLPKLGMFYSCISRNSHQRMYDKYRLKLYSIKQSYAGMKFFNNFLPEI